LEWVQGEGEQDNKRKVIRFAYIFMLLNKQKPMINYKDFKPFFSFLNLKNNPKKHWNDTIGWEIVEHVHNQVLATSKFGIQATMFVALRVNAHYGVNKLREIWNYI